MLPLLLAGALAGCTHLTAGGPPPDPAASRADLAYAALARGEFPQALDQANLALAGDPEDPHAHYVRGVALRYGGRPEEAAEVFSRLIASPRAQDAAVAGGPWTGTSPTTVAVLARDQLQAMGIASGLPTTLTASGDLAAGIAPLSDGVMPAVGAPTEPPLSGIELMNAAQRFLVLRRLRDDGRITDGEYSIRRAANIGVLLPFSSQRPGAAGLGRPVPTAEQVGARLEALRHTLASGAMRPEDHAAERETILDALLPADPRVRMMAPTPPTSLADAAERANALQRLRDMGVISKEEYARERAALEKAAGRLIARADGGNTVLVPKAPAKPAASSGKPSKPAAPAKPAAPPRNDAEALDAIAAGAGGNDRMVGRGPIVVAPPAAATPAAPSAAAGGPVVLHLASYKSKAAAESGWSALRGRFSSVLSGLAPQYTEVDLGPGKGTFWRLSAGPVSDSAAAERLCGQLAGQGQYCRTAFASR
ncbi:hypothetical protein GCM10009099_25170 [Caenispirillum bisanense]